MLVDEVKLNVTAGKGGDGAMNFNKEMMSQGPTGGNGGDGGSVYIKGVSDLGALEKFRFKKEFKAEDGKTGAGQCKDGGNGEDLILEVPVGTVAHNLDSGKITEVTKINEQVIIAGGGSGGKGNYHFRSSRRTTPYKFQYGKEGDSFSFQLELKLIADIGLVGLPNTGKSSLLNELTRAKSKVANYRFTTLEPSLGTYNELILADIPGLIEGASLGKGLGFKFLRHIERTKVIFHLISCETYGAKKEYDIIREELGAHHEKLLEKEEYIFLSKKDAVSETRVKELIEEFKKMGKEALPISIIDEQSINDVRKTLEKIIEDKKWEE